VNLTWESQGEGAPVLLIHGLGYTRQGWGPLRERLARRYRVISFDNRGIGESDIPPGPYRVEDMAGDALQVLDEAGAERAHVLGASLGGFVAQVVAADRPERVDRLILACTSPGGPDSYPLPEATLRLMTEAPSLAPEVALRRFVENAVAVGSRTELIDEIYAYRQAHPPDPAGWAAQAGAGAAWDAGDRLERIAAPTLVVTGTADTVVDPRNSELIAGRIHGAQLERLEGAGHMLFWEQSEEFAGVVERFLG
jgi:pimeloyl-ACP methyl ester carboxylesterase